MTRTFVLQVVLAEALVREDQDRAVALAYELLDGIAAKPMRGPRGGKYLATTEVYVRLPQQSVDDWIRSQWRFVGRVEGRYVRPRTAA